MDRVTNEGDVVVNTGWPSGRALVGGYDRQKERTLAGGRGQYPGLLFA